MNQFDYKKRNLASGPHLLGVLLIFAGLLALVSLVFFKEESDLERTLGVGLGAIIIGVLIVFSYSGTSFDFIEKRFREYTSIGGYKIGEWEALPAITTVQVISSTYKVTNIPNGISPTLTRKVTDSKVLLFSNAPQANFSFVYSSKQKAMKHAGSLATLLNAELELHI